MFDWSLNTLLSYPVEYIWMPGSAKSFIVSQARHQSYVKKSSIRNFNDEDILFIRLEVLHLIPMNFCTKFVEFVEVCWNWCPKRHYHDVLKLWSLLGRQKWQITDKVLKHFYVNDISAYTVSPLISAAVLI